MAGPKVKEAKTKVLRGRFATKLGFVLSGVGAAVGLGNIWRFPQLTSENGGAAFVVVYLAMMVLIGIPLLWGELSLGQRGQYSSVGALERVAGPRWRWLGFLFLASTFLFFSYYQVIAGQALRYFLFAPTDRIEQNPAAFLIDSSGGMDAVFFTLLTAAIVVGIVSFGVKNGLEKANLVMMPGLFVILIGLAIYALSQPGAGAGVEFYLAPDLSQVTAATLLAAMGQVFFSVGIAFGIMLTYASYVNPGKSMFGSSLMIAGSDLGVALMAGFMIFPLVFAQGLEAQVIGEGIGNSQALFLTMPVAFIQIGGFLGKFLMLAFFIMLTFAAASSSIAALEVIVSWLDDTFAWARYRSAVIATVYAMVLGSIAAVSPVALGWMDSFLATVLLIAGGFGISLVYGLAIRDRVNLLLGDDGHPPKATVTAASVFSIILVFVVPILLAVIFLVTLPCTINALLFLDLPTPTWAC